MTLAKIGVRCSECRCRLNAVERATSSSAGESGKLDLLRSAKLEQCDRYCSEESGSAPVGQKRLGCLSMSPVNPSDRLS